MTLNTLTARIGIEKKKKHSLKVAQPPAEASTLRGDLEKALEEVKNHQFIRIDPENWEADIRRRLSKRD